MNPRPCSRVDWVSAVLRWPAAGLEQQDWAPHQRPGTGSRPLPLLLLLGRFRERWRWWRRRREEPSQDVPAEEEDLPQKSVTLQESPSSSQLGQTPNTTPSLLHRRLVVRQRRGAPVRGPEGEPASGRSDGGAELRLVPALRQRRTVEGAATAETSPRRPQQQQQQPPPLPQARGQDHAPCWSTSVSTG